MFDGACVVSAQLQLMSFLAQRGRKFRHIVMNIMSPPRARCLFLYIEGAQIQHQADHSPIFECNDAATTMRALLPVAVQHAEHSVKPVIQGREASLQLPQNAQRSCAQL